MSIIPKYLRSKRGSLHPGRLTAGTYKSPMKGKENDLNQTSIIYGPAVNLPRVYFFHSWKLHPKKRSETKRNFLILTSRRLPSHLRRRIGFPSFTHGHLESSSLVRHVFLHGKEIAGCKGAGLVYYNLCIILFNSEKNRHIS